MAGESDILKKIMGLIGGTGGAAAVSQLNPVTAIASAVPALFQTGLGISQELKADKLAKSTTRPIMGTPGALLESVANARNMAGGQAPGITQAMNQLAQSNAGTDFNIMQTGQGGAETLAALLARSNQGANSAMNIGAMQENYTNNAMMNLQNQLAQLQQSQEAQYMYNKDEPYRNIMKASQDLHNAAPQNVQIGLNSLGGSLASMVGPMGEKLDGTVGDGAGRLSGLAGNSVGTIGTETPVNAQNQEIDKRNMGPQGEGPQNGMVAYGQPTKTPILTPGADENVQRMQVSPMTPITTPPNLMPTILAPQRDLTPMLGSSAKPALLGGAFNNIVKMMENLKGGDPSVDRRIKAGEANYRKYNQGRF